MVNRLWTLMTFCVLLASSSDAMAADWVVINEFGRSKVYVDNDSIERNGASARLAVKYVLVPHGTDKRNGKPVKEMLLLEEYETRTGNFRVHRIVFTYADGEIALPLETEPVWVPASGGNEITLNYIRQRFGG